MTRNRVNPRRRPASAADVARAKQDAVHEATVAATVILFSVLRDRKGMTTGELQDIWAAVNDRSDSINQGYCSLSDLRDTLAREDGIYIN